jgi:hypothetical protein
MDDRHRVGPGNHGRGHRRAKSAAARDGRGTKAAPIRHAAEGAEAGRGSNAAAGAKTSTKATPVAVATGMRRNSEGEGKDGGDDRDEVSHGFSLFGF